MASTFAGLSCSALIFALLLPAASARAANSHSIDLERDSSQYLEIADSNQTGLDLGGDLTFEFWIKLESDDGGVLIAKRNPPTLERGFGFSLLADGSSTINKVQFTNSSDGINLGFADVLWAPSLATWYHVALVYDANGGGSTGQIELFVNGISQGTATGDLKTVIFNNSAPFRIAIDDDLATGRFFDGQMDDVRVWNDVRTATEIGSSLFQQLTGTEPNLVAYWKLDNDLLDETSNNNDLTNVNGATFSTDAAFSTVPMMGFPVLLALGLLILGTRACCRRAVT